MIFKRPKIREFIKNGSNKFQHYYSQNNQQSIKILRDYGIVELEENLGLNKKKRFYRLTKKGQELKGILLEFERKLNQMSVW